MIDQIAILCSTFQVMRKLREKISQWKLTDISIKHKNKYIYRSSLFLE